MEKNHFIIERCCDGSLPRAVVRAVLALASYGVAVAVTLRPLVLVLDTGGVAVEAAPTVGVALAETSLPAGVAEVSGPFETGAPEVGAGVIV